jgi:hypothetical protein
LTQQEKKYVFQNNFAYQPAEPNSILKKSPATTTTNYPTTVQHQQPQYQQSQSIQPPLPQIQYHHQPQPQEQQSMVEYAYVQNDDPPRYSYRESIEQQSDSLNNKSDHTTHTVLEQQPPEQQQYQLHSQSEVHYTKTAQYEAYPEQPAAHSQQHQHQHQHQQQDNSKFQPIDRAISYVDEGSQTGAQSYAFEPPGKSASYTATPAAKTTSDRLYATTGHSHVEPPSQQPRRRTKSAVTSGSSIGERAAHNGKYKYEVRGDRVDLELSTAKHVVLHRKPFDWYEASNCRTQIIDESEQIISESALRMIEDRFLATGRLPAPSAPYAPPPAPRSTAPAAGYSEPVAYQKPSARANPVPYDPRQDPRHDARYDQAYSEPAYEYVDALRGPPRPEPRYRDDPNRSFSNQDFDYASGGGGGGRGGFDLGYDQAAFGAPSFRDGRYQKRGPCQSQGYRDSVGRISVRSYFGDLLNQRMMRKKHADMRY